VVILIYVQSGGVTVFFGLQIGSSSYTVEFSKPLFTEFDCMTETLTGFGVSVPSSFPCDVLGVTASLEAV
jgi:hypothetical protein